MFETILSSLLPVAFVIFLGWFAGFAKVIDKVHSKSLATFVMNFSFPSLLFVITATSKLEDLLNIRLVMAFTLGLVGMYLVALFVHMLFLQRSRQENSQAAFVCAFPDMAFMGIPIFIELLGKSSLISIAIGNIITSVIMIPLTIILIEMKQQEGVKFFNVFFTNFKRVIKKPLVFSPVLGALYAMSGLTLPALAEHSLKLIGDSTSGVSLFALGLMMSSYAIKVNRNVALNITLKNVIHPFIMLGLVWLFGISGVLAKELVLLCAMPTATMTTMFALRYNTLTEESTSSAILGTLISVVTLSFFMMIVHV